jgi:hypothetical protein
MSENELKDGVVGREIVAYFQNLDGRVAVAAKSIGTAGMDRHDYEITFEDGTVQSYRVTFGSEFPTHILYMEPLN